MPLQEGFKKSRRGDDKSEKSKFWPRSWMANPEFQESEDSTESRGERGRGGRDFSRWNPREGQHSLPGIQGISAYRGSWNTVGAGPKPESLLGCHTDDSDVPSGTPLPPPSCTQIKVPARRRLPGFYNTREKPFTGLLEMTQLPKLCFNSF